MQEVRLSTTSSAQPGQPETGADGGLHPAQVKRRGFGFLIEPIIRHMLTYEKCSMH